MNDNKYTSLLVFYCMMKKYMKKNNILILFLCIIIFGLWVYIFQTIQQSKFPLGDSRLRGWTYLGMIPTDCEECNVVQFYWQNKADTDCSVLEVVTSWTKETLTSATKKLKILNLQTYWLWERQNKKWEKKYVFDKWQFDLFSIRCPINF